MNNTNLCKENQCSSKSCILIFKVLYFVFAIKPFDLYIADSFALDLMELSSKVDQDLADIDEKKKEEVEGEEKFQAKLGARTPSQVCAALWKDAKNYHTYHGQAVSHSKPPLSHRFILSFPSATFSPNPTRS